MNSFRSLLAIILDSGAYASVYFAFEALKLLAPSEPYLFYCCSDSLGIDTATALAPCLGIARSSSRYERLADQDTIGRKKDRRNEKYSLRKNIWFGAIVRHRC